MIRLQYLCILVLIAPILGDGINNKKFPKGFMFGTATASYQVEGGWNADGKGPQIWDTLTHENPDFIKNRDNGDVACDSYHKYKEDVQLLKFLGVTHYRFSISWSRILPTGHTNKINEAGVQYYKNLIKELRDNNIEPLVTLYHWDLPQPLQDAGGWPNPYIIEWFTDYAKVCFELFGDSVKYWLTFNEPKQTCYMGYGGGILAPVIKSPEATYMCSHHVLLAHANVWHLYNETFRKTQNGKVGFVIDSSFFQPETNKTSDIAAAETELQFNFGWYANPLVYGDYPAVMKEHIARRSKAAGYSKSLLPEFSARASNFVKGTLDYLGVNIYTAEVAKSIDYHTDSLGWKESIEVDTYQPTSWKGSASPWLKITPWAMRGLVSWVSKTYNNISIIITENGLSDNGTTLQDEDRIDQIQTYLSSLRDAIEYDKVNVFGYTHWSLLDNFEWISGYTQKFGLFHVDFSSPKRIRTPKKSVFYYKQVISTRCLVENCTE